MPHSEVCHICKKLKSVGDMVLIQVNGHSEYVCKTHPGVDKLLEEQRGGRQKQRHSRVS